jgi:hypothetical protein
LAIFLRGFGPHKNTQPSMTFADAAEELILYGITNGKPDPKSGER